MNLGNYDDLLRKYAGKTPDELRALAKRATARGDESELPEEAHQWYDVAYALDAMADRQEQRAEPDAPRYTDDDVARLASIARCVGYCIENGTIVTVYTRRVLHNLLQNALAPFAEQDNE